MKTFLLATVLGLMSMMSLGCSSTGGHDHSAHAGGAMKDCCAKAGSQCCSDKEMCKKCCADKKCCSDAAACSKCCGK